MTKKYSLDDSVYGRVRKGDDEQDAFVFFRLPQIECPVCQLVRITPQSLVFQGAGKAAKGQDWKQPFERGSKLE